jgi:multimeric flavodoxin WrbA
MQRKSKIRIINGALGGSAGNTAALLKIFTRSLEHTDFTISHLADGQTPTETDLATADGFVFCTGVYWDSWGSPLQIFFENATPLEGAPCWFGKPAAAIVTMHSVGGKEILNRLLGVINTFGLFTPPMSAMTYSLANQMALAHEAADADSEFAKDLWCPDDLKVLAANLTLASQIQASAKTNWSSWPTDRSNPKRIWLTDALS